MHRALRPCLALALTLAAGCAGPDRSVDEGRAAVISDQAHGGAVRGFFFLPPLVPMPALEGTLLAGARPTVRIDEIAGGVSVRTLATYTTETGLGSETVRESADHYLVNWHTDLLALDPARLYRIRVFLGDREIGFADVDVVESGRELRNVDRDEYIPLLNGRTLPIKFWVNRCAEVACRPAPCRLGGECDPATGACSSTPAPDGTACDDLDPATAGDACRGGVCAGTPTPPRCGDGRWDPVEECDYSFSPTCGPECRCLPGMIRDGRGGCMPGPPPGACGPLSCGGCCQGEECLPGDAPSACGTRGALCVACSPAATCSAGACVFCADGGCPTCGDGILDPGEQCEPRFGPNCFPDCVCQPGTFPDGRGGCVPDGGACGPLSCAGCCMGDLCLPGDGPAGCGIGGAACATCAAGEACNRGLCMVCPPSICAYCGDGVLASSEECDPGIGPGCASDCRCLPGLIPDGTGGCVPGGTACGPATCGGCCLDGECLPGNTIGTCGSGGAACAACASGRVCAGGACVPCSDPTCAACGDGVLGPGEECEPRFGPGCAPDCRCLPGLVGDGSGRCIATDGGAGCGPASCGGCCAGDVCLPGEDAAACGAAGTACVACAGTDTCSGGACVHGGGGCGPLSCAGCCAGDVCTTGGSLAACGLGGAACIACSAAEACVGGLCVAGATCGDGRLDPTEQCEPAFSPHCTSCHCDAGYDPDGMGGCTLRAGVCGNGWVDGPDEVCDDGNRYDDDDCTNLCLLPERGMLCIDGADNDRDGLVDAADPGCGGGLCAGVVCPPSDACSAWRCEPTTGLCVRTVAANGVVCSDGNACTRLDTCQWGTCVGGAPVDCSTQCAVGTCDPATGACLFPMPRTDDTPCDDRNVCTFGDRCRSGICAGAPLSCDDHNPCTDDSCDPLTGCRSVPNSAPCGDGGICSAGICMPR